MIRYKAKPAPNGSGAKTQGFSLLTRNMFKKWDCVQKFEPKI
jgi:hypothetical protein